VPPDETVFAIFSAGSADIVSRTCGRAGVPPERITFAAGLAQPMNSLRGRRGQLINSDEDFHVEH